MPVCTGFFEMVEEVWIIDILVLGVTLVMVENEGNLML